MNSTALAEQVFHRKMAESGEPEFLARLQRKEPEAYRELVERYGQMLYNTALRITGAPGDAEDALQETYLSAYEHVGAFEGRSSLKTWLTRICINAAVTGVRRKTRHSTTSLDEPLTLGERGMTRWVADRRENPEQAARASEFHRLLEGCLRKLSPALRHVFVLRDLEELSSEETAQALGISVSAAKTRLCRARAALRGYLEPHLAGTVGTGPHARRAPRPSSLALNRASVRQAQPQSRQPVWPKLLGSQPEFRPAGQALFA